MLRVLILNVVKRGFMLRATSSDIAVENFGIESPCLFGLSPTSQQYFSLGTNQPLATNQQYFSLRTNQHQPPVKRTG
jgi:hypothetical protein